MHNNNRYSARITRDNPSAFVFIVDTSGSMGNRINFNGSVMSKASAVASLINSTLEELVSRCRREDGYRDYFDIAVIGCGGDDAHSLLPEGSSHPVFRKPGELAASDVRRVKIFKDRVLPSGLPTVTVTENREWVTPRSLGKTPMLHSLTRVYELVREWILANARRNCFPPVIINITDGEATDSDDDSLRRMADNIKSLSTSDGNVLFMNVYISGDSETGAVLFPSCADELPESRYARLLFDMSSEMPDSFCEAIHETARDSCGGRKRAMSYNSSMADVVNMLNIGTISINRVE